MAHLPDWVRFGVWTDAAAATGVSVFHFPHRASAALSIGGYGAGTRHVDRLLRATNAAPVDAILLAGGSAWGMAAAEGVMGSLEDMGQGEPIRNVRVPIVPTAVLFDLFAVRGDVRPSAAAGRAAMAVAGDTVDEGCCGAGAGAAVGKLSGMARATKSGAGWAAEEGPAGFLAVYAVANAFGDVVDPETGRVVAGLRGDEPGSWAFSEAAMALEEPGADEAGGHTTLVVALADGSYTGADLRYMADYIQRGLRVCVRPAQTPADGDAVFVAASNGTDAHPPVSVAIRLERLMRRAIRRAVITATGSDELPACREWEAAGRVH